MAFRCMDCNGHDNTTERGGVKLRERIFSGIQDGRAFRVYRRLPAGPVQLHADRLNRVKLVSIGASSVVVLLRHDVACPRRAMTDQLEDPRTAPLRFRVASAAEGGGCAAENGKEKGADCESRSSVHRDKPGGGAAEASARLNTRGADLSRGCPRFGAASAQRMQAGGRRRWAAAQTKKEICRRASLKHAPRSSAKTCRK